MDKLPLVQAVLAHPEKHPLPLEHHLSVALRELSMEQVRRESFPEYPSRMACLYVSETLEESRRWADFFIHIGRPTYAIVKLQVEGRCFAGNACNCFDGTPNQAENLANALRYWLNLPSSGVEPVQEMLVDGVITVAEIVQELNANLPE